MKNWKEKLLKKYEILEFYKGKWISSGKMILNENLLKDIENLLKEQIERVNKEVCTKCRHKLGEDDII